MKKILSEYLNIYTTFPANTHLSKPQKKLRHQALKTWADTTFDPMPTFEEVVVFMKKYNILKFEKPFLMKVLIPPVAKDVSLGNVEMLKFLFECDEIDEQTLHDNGYAQRKYYVQMLQEATNWRYSDWELMDMVLTVEPENEIVLKAKYESLARFISYSVHEIPSGVLVGFGGASKNDMPEIFEHLDEFVRISKN